MNYDFPLSCLIADTHFDFNRVLATPSLDKQVESNSRVVWYIPFLSVWSVWEFAFKLP